MATHDKAVEIPVDGRQIPGTMVTPTTKMPGFLFVQGWGSGQEQYLARAREIAALGCACLTFEPRGVARDHPEHETVSRDENLRDILAAYDVLASQPAVDAAAIGVVGSSYGGYLAAVLSSLRPVRWLALRVPALYRDEDWALPKRRLDREELDAYRRTRSALERTGPYAPVRPTMATCWWSSPSTTWLCPTRPSPTTSLPSSGRIR